MQTSDEFRVDSSNTKRKRAANIIISDDEDSYDSLKTRHTSRHQNKPEFSHTDASRGARIRMQTGDEDANYTDEEHVNEFRVRSSNTRIARRKIAANIITSDNESSYDDNAPICTLKTRHSSRFVTDSEEKVEENVTNESEDDNDVLDSSESVSVCDFESGYNTDEYEDVLNVYKVIWEKNGSKKILNPKWDREADMLSDFGKDPELCMSAVCALYRQQTDDEKASTETHHQNKRGFSQTDASRGSKLAKFLTDGDSNGDLNKTVEELNKYDSEGIDRCMELAPKYSKQLFKIYWNKEDPYFPPRQ